MKNDDDDPGPAIYAEYERLMGSPDELEDLADRLEIPHDGQLQPTTSGTRRLDGSWKGKRKNAPL